MNTSAELEFLNELEDELESELGVSAGEFETELSHEADAEVEAEQFFGALAGLASRAVRSPALRRLALDAARSAIRAVTESEFETEAGEHELSPIRRVYPDAMMEHLAHEAQEAESEQEAVEAFLPLIPLMAAKALPLAMKAAPLVAKLGAKVLPQLAGKVLPKIAGRVAPRLFGQFMRSAPQMSRAVQGLTRRLWQNQRTRPLLRTVPTIVRRASVQLMKGAMRGRPITPRNAVRAIASNSVRVLSNPRAGVGAYRRSRRLDRRFHGTRGRRMRGGPAAGGGGSMGAPSPMGAGPGVDPATAAAAAAAGAPIAAGGGGGCNCSRRCPTCGR